MKSKFKVVPLFLRGEKAKIAKLARIEPSHLSDILKGRRGISYDMSIRLANASAKTQKRKITWVQWLRLANAE